MFKKIALSAMMVSTSVFAQAVSTEVNVEKKPEMTQDITAIKVNGVAFSKKEVMAPLEGQVTEEQLKDPRFAAAYAKFLEQFARRQAFIADAKIAVQDNDPDFVKRLAEEKEAIRAEIHVMRNVAKVSDAELQAAYKEKFEGAAAKGDRQVHAHHVLFKDEKDAQKFIAGLKGDNFKAEAEKAKAAGHRFEDLGFFSFEDMVEPFSKAAFALKEGEASKAPVKSSFGHHVIQVLKTKEKAAPKFEDVKDMLTQELSRKKVEAKGAELMAKAKVEYFDLDGKPFDPEAARKPAMPAGMDAKASAFAAAPTA